MSLGKHKVLIHAFVWWMWRRIYRPRDFNLAQVDSCSDARRFCSPRDCLTCGKVFFGQMTLKKHGERFLQVFIKLLVETRTKACRTSHSGNSYMKVLVCRNRNSSSSSHKAMRSEILGMNAARKQCGEHTSGNSAHQGTQHSTELSTAEHSCRGQRGPRASSTPSQDPGITWLPDVESLESSHQVSPAQES